MDEELDESTSTAHSEGAIRKIQPQAIDFAVGATVAGRYKVLNELGRGGMAVVYKVEQVFLKEILALKVLRYDLSDSSIVRFQKEAQVCRRLEHPNLIRVYDFDVLEDNSPFLVMEFLQGKTLAELLKSEGSLSEKTVIDIFTQVLDGLDYAHHQGVIHRDMKPSNIMINCESPENYSVKVVDFGIAKMVGIDGLNSMSLTRTGEIFGSPLYMSPEQCLGKTVDLRSDLYSVGCAIYQALTGAPPFAGASALSTMMMHQNDEPILLKDASLGKVYSAAIERVIFRLLAKSVSERYQSAAEVRSDLLAIRAKRGLKVQQKTKVVRERKSIAPVLVIVFSFVCVALTAVLTFIIMTQLNSKSVTSPSAPMAQQSEEASLIQGKAYFAKVPINSYKAGPWTLRFPSMEVGKVALSSFPCDTKVMCSAEGVITFLKAAPLAFMTDMSNGFKNEDFLRFRPDEIAELFLTDSSITDGSLEKISSYRSLRKLELRMCSSLTDHCVPYIAKLPGIEVFSVIGKSISGGRIGYLAKNLAVSTLIVRNSARADDLARELDGANHLLFLYLENSNDLSDDGLLAISKLKQLRVVSFVGCPAITDFGISKLKDLPHLEAVALQDTKVSARSISAFKHFPRHCFIGVDCTKWSETDRALFFKALPNFRVP